MTDRGFVEVDGLMRTTAPNIYAVGDLVPTAQLAHIGSPIVGDVLYGGKAYKENEIKLHAERLTIMHPKTEQALVLEAPLPEGW